MNETAKRPYGLRRIEGLERAIIDRKLAESLEGFVRKKYEREMKTLEEVGEEINREVVPYSDSKKRVDRYWLMRFCRKVSVKIRDNSEAKIVQNRGKIKISEKNRKILEADGKRRDDYDIVDSVIREGGFARSLKEYVARRKGRVSTGIFRELMGDVEGVLGEDVRAISKRGLYSVVLGILYEK